MSKKRAKILISHILTAAVCATSVPVSALPVYAAAQENTEVEHVGGERSAVPSKFEFANDINGWTAEGSWGGASSQVLYDPENGGRLKAELDFSGCASIQDWPAAVIQYKDENGMDFSAYNSMSMEIYYKADAAPEGIAVSAEAKDGDSSLLTGQYGITDQAEDAGDGWKKTVIKLPIDEAAAQSARPKELKLLFTTGSFQQAGTVWIDNLTFRKVGVEPVLESYAFTDGTQGWKAENGWLSSGVTQAVSHDAQAGRLALQLDYSGTSEEWPNAAVCVEAEGGFDFSAYNKLSFDFYYKPEDKTRGDLILKAIAETGSGAQEQIFQKQENSVTDSVVQVTDAADGYKKATFTFQLTEANTQAVHPTKFLLVVAAHSTDFSGMVYLDNIHFFKEALYVNSTVAAAEETLLSTDSNAVTVNGAAQSYASDLKLVDANADTNVKKVYQYLKAVGESEAVVYGHMEDTVLKAGYAGLSESDTKDVTGSLPAIDGYDCGELFQGFTDKYQKRNADLSVLGDGSQTEKNINAAAWFANQSIAEGAIVTLSAHMPNFAYTQRRDNPLSDKTYDQFDYTPADAYKVDNGECMKHLLPGQEYNEAYRAYLDMIAEYAGKVKGAVLFRPLHENTGGWFWWGNACTAETYKSVFKYTVEYLRDIKGVHNFIYAYGPGTEAGNEAEYEERYPGDGYVDLVGFDSYDANPKTDAQGYTYLADLEKTIQLTSSFAQKHGKLFAITETGIANGSIALLPKDNPRTDWYCDILNLASKPEYRCCYFMLWSNYASSAGYYTPYVIRQNEDGSLYGHEMLDAFIRFYNDKRSIFADTQKAVLDAAITAPTVQAADGGAMDGYFISPAEGSRLTEAVTICARLVKQTTEAVTFILTGVEGQSLELEAVPQADGQTYTAQLTDEQLAAFTPEPDGSLALYVGGKEIQKLWYILNIGERTSDPLVVDDFESYLGRDTLLKDQWAVNKSSNSSLAVSLADDVHSADGKYAMKLAFSLKKGGYVGTEIAKTADWSACNALQFWVNPDGQNQKTVVQIKVGNDAYEAYLNQYDDYRLAQNPLLVTLPFQAFVHKESGVCLTSADVKGLTGLGLWINALDESFADSDSALDGNLYYDDIKAVTTDSTAPVFEQAPENTEQPGEDEKTEEDDTQPGDETQKPDEDQPQQPGGDKPQQPGGSTQQPGGSILPGGTNKPNTDEQKPGSGDAQEPGTGADEDSVPDQVENKTKQAEQNPDGTFTDADGKILKNTMVEAADGNTYITDKQGRKRTSEFVETTDGTTYYVKESGIVAKKEIIKAAGGRYFAKEIGALAKAEFCTTAKGSTIYAKKDGTLASNQVITVNNRKYFIKESGALAKKGFYTTAYGNRVYARKTGELITNRVFVSAGSRYFAKSSGAVAKGCFCTTASGNRVYAAASGRLVSNKIFRVGGSRYYAKKSGAIAVKRWVKVGNKKYYCAASGKITKTKK